jgi:hypothetical protein
MTILKEKAAQKMLMTLTRDIQTDTCLPLFEIGTLLLIFRRISREASTNFLVKKI